MTVRVRVFAALAPKLSKSLSGRHPGGIRAGMTLEERLPQGSTVADLVLRLGLSEREVLATFVNGRSRELSHALVDGDEVGIFPPVGGG